MRELREEFPEPRYAKSADLHIAYRVHGEGPFDVVLVPPWYWSIDTFGMEPEELAAFAELSSIARVIAFDKRGSGSSDKIVGAPTLEERMDDVRAVMDAALAVATGARIAAEADEGEVLVSGTVKDLVAGSGISFESRGDRELKGLGERPLYAVVGATA